MATKMNKKMIFRSPLAVLLLAASMLGLGAVSLVSCGTSDQKQPDNPDNQKNTTAETTAPVETEALFDDEMPERDMNGFELNILNYTETALGWALKDINRTEETGDQVNDAIYARNRRIEDR